MTEMFPPAPAAPPAEELKIDELKLLKQQADVMGLKYSNNIGVEALSGKISEAMKASDKGKDEPAPPQVPPGMQSVPIPAPGPAKSAKDPDRPKTRSEIMQEKRLLLHREYMRLVRVRIVNLDPSKADLKGEILTVANKYLGKVSKLVPYGDACGPDGYHIPYILLLFMRERKFSKITTDKNNYPSASDVQEFAIEELPPLTAKQIQRLKDKQAAAAGMVESESDSE